MLLLVQSSTLVLMVIDAHLIVPIPSCICAENSPNAFFVKGCRGRPCPQTALYACWMRCTPYTHAWPHRTVRKPPFVAKAWRRRGTRRSRYGVAGDISDGWKMGALQNIRRKSELECGFLYGIMSANIVFRSESIIKIQRKNLT